MSNAFAQAFAFVSSPAIAVHIVYLSVLMIALAGWRWTAIYVGLMPVINWAFSAVETFPLPDWAGGGVFQPLAIVAGLVMVVRDFAQREIKHWIFAAMAAGLLLSSLTAWITIVFASGTAFLISETVDWAFYTFSNRPFSQRIMISSLASAPLDQIVFIWLASFVVPGMFALGTILTGVASKLLGAWIVSQLMAARERRRTATVQMKAA